jgi:hypothetical protein
MKPSNLLMIFVSLLAITRGYANDSDQFLLPPSKINIESCHNEILLRHPGTIEKERILNRHNNHWLQYEIQAFDGSEWVVLCDLRNKNIINEQKLFDTHF